MVPEQRPDILTITSSKELLRWYWLKSELITLARRLGVNTTGGKEDLTLRLTGKLDGAPLPAPRPTRPSGPPLDGDLTLTTILPRGQRLTSHLRDFFLAHLGPAFRFDGHMRRFIAQGEGQTLAAAIAHWKATRNAPPMQIDAQFELNRFARQWFTENTDGSRSDMLEAWRRYRSLPRDLRAKA